MDQDDREDELGGWLRGHELSVDVVAALAVLAVCLGWGVRVGSGQMYALVSIALVLPLALRRRHPAVCLAAVVTVAFLQWVTSREALASFPAHVAVPIAVHAAAAHGSTAVGRTALVAGLVGAVLGGTTWPRPDAAPSEHLLVGGFLAATVVAAWTAGALHRARSLRTTALADRARMLEVERAQRDHIAVLGERRRVARDMHDVVAHALAGVIAQADGARYAGTGHPGALAEIAAHARRALADIRRIVGVLRDDGDVAHAPHPGIADLPFLVETVRSAGPDVRLDVDPRIGDSDPGLSVTVYRIVQEGLTNVVRHARAERVEVTVERRPGALRVEVRDDGPTPLPTGEHTGHGLLGMRERVAAHHGHVALTDLPGGGHLLRAEIPVPS